MGEDAVGVPRILEPPPVLFFGCLGIAYGLDRLRPREIVPWSGCGRIALFFLLSVASFVFAAWAFRVLKAAGTTVELSQPTSRIVEAGPFRVSRNPLYLSLVLLFVSFGVLLNSVWYVVLAPALLALLHFGVVLPEERYLTDRFGQPYLEYRRRVRRWI